MARAVVVDGDDVVVVSSSNIILPRLQIPPGRGDTVVVSFCLLTPMMVAKVNTGFGCGGLVGRHIGRSF